MPCSPYCKSSMSLRIVRVEGVLFYLILQAYSSVQVLLIFFERAWAFQKILLRFICVSNTSALGYLTFRQKQMKPKKMLCQVHSSLAPEFPIRQVYCFVTFILKVMFSAYVVFLCREITRRKLARGPTLSQLSVVLSNKINHRSDTILEFLNFHEPDSLYE
jgi:hypothetical protein